MEAVRQDVHHIGVEMATVTVCVMWHLVALMVVTAVVGLGLGRVGSGSSQRSNMMSLVEHLVGEARRVRSNGMALAVATQEVVAVSR